MPEPIETAANPNPAVDEGKDESLLGNPNQDAPEVKPEDKPADTKPEEKKPDDNLLDDAAKEDKANQDAADKKLLETDDKDLSAEDKTKKDVLVKAQEETVKKEEADKKANEVPEKYEFKVPEGMALDQALADKVSPIFKEMKLSQVAAQKLVDVYAGHLKDLSDTQAKEFDTFLADSKRETIKELGVDYKKELSFAAKVRNGLFSKETIELLNGSGLSNNVNLIKDFIKLGKLVSEDHFVKGSPVPDKISDADRMYPNQGK